MDDAPEKIWAMPSIDGKWRNGRCTNEHHKINNLTAPFLLEYTRSDIAEAEVARLRQALRTMIYEITDLSPLEDDGTYWCKISDEALTSAIASVEHKD